MKLDTLLQRLPEARPVGPTDVDVRRAVHDSRIVRPGDLFVALPGTRVDGHQFVQSAIDAGAAGAVVERPLELPGEPTLVVVPDPREALGVLAHALAGDPTQRLTVVGITGTNGKTTTTYLVRSVLQRAGMATGLIGTIAYTIGERQIRSHMTTPDATDLAGYFAEMVDEGMAAAVMEVSSHALDQRRTAGIAFDVGALTNISEEHLDYHKDMASYRAAKSRLFEGLDAGATAALNSDEPAAEEFAAATDARTLWYGLERAADVGAEDVRKDLAGSRFTLVTPRGRAAAETRLLGSHNIKNCLTAAAIGEALEIDLDAIVEGLAAVDRVPGRLDPVLVESDVTVLVDYAHTADALANALATVRELVPGRLICVFGCGGDRDRTKRPKMAATVERLADLPIVTADNPRSEDPADIAEEMMPGFERPEEVILELDRRTAIERAIDEAEPGDVVLIAGKGHETYQETSQGITEFDDRQVAREILETL